MKWADFRNQLRRSILSDAVSNVNNGSKPKWSDEQLLDAVWWALDTFAAHTAYTKLVRYDNQTEKLPGLKYDLSKDREFHLPDDAYEPIDRCGVVYITQKDGRITYLDPLQYTPGKDLLRTAQSGFYLWPEDTLHVVGKIPPPDAVYIRYFAYYPRPLKDDDLLEIPRWSESAMAYLCGAYALASVATQSASIDRWKDKTDSGNPEDNAIRAQHEYFMLMYERSISRYPRQDRIAAFRTS